MAYKVIILYRLYMPSYFLGTFTEYPYVLSVMGYDRLAAFFMPFHSYSVSSFSISPFRWYIVIFPFS